MIKYFEYILRILVNDSPLNLLNFLQLTSTYNFRGKILVPISNSLEISGLSSPSYDQNSNSSITTYSI